MIYLIKLLLSYLNILYNKRQSSQLNKTEEIENIKEILKIKTG
jgi:hypothetical protein